MASRNHPCCPCSQSRAETVFAMVCVSPFALLIIFFSLNPTERLRWNAGQRLVVRRLLSDFASASLTEARTPSAYNWRFPCFFTFFIVRSRLPRLEWNFRFQLLERMRKSTWGAWPYWISGDSVTRPMDGRRDFAYASPVPSGPVAISFPFSV